MTEYLPYRKNAQGKLLFIPADIKPSAEYMACGVVVGVRPFDPKTDKEPDYSIGAPARQAERGNFARSKNVSQLLAQVAGTKYVFMTADGKAKAEKGAHKSIDINAVTNLACLQEMGADPDSYEIVDDTQPASKTTKPANPKREN